MIDSFDIPNSGVYHKTIFATGNATWVTWQKPSGIKFIYSYVLGAGGAGGGGRTGGVNSGGGGGGGGSSAISVGLYPAFMLPDIMYIQVGAGSAGAAAGTGAASGMLSYISAAPNTTAINIIMQSGDAAAGGGGGGTNTGNGSGVGGTAGSIWTYTSYPIPKVGMITSIAGQTGAIGGTNLPAAGTSITPSLPITGGGGGGGVSAAGTPTGGGSITGSGFLPTISGGITGAITGGHGYMPTMPTAQSYLSQPLVFTGAGGGSATGTGVGGFGGNASYGSGGGGGGASYNSTGGTGGRGGDGLILISCW